MGKLAGHMMGLRQGGKLGRPSLMVHATIETSNGNMPSSDHYDKQEHKRLKSEVAAHQEALDNWDPEAVLEHAHKSLKAEHAHKKTRLAELEASMKARKASRMPIGKRKSKQRLDDEEDAKDSSADEAAEGEEDGF